MFKKLFLTALSIFVFVSISSAEINTAGHVTKFGRNIETDSGVTADIWDGGHTVASGGVSLIWVAPTQARLHNIVSSSDLDGKTSAPSSVGARTLRIWGLKTWSTYESSEDITLNGTTVVPTVNSYVIIHRMAVLTKGATDVNVGIIKATAQTDNTITAQIRASQGQSQMSIYGIPSGYTLLVGRLYGNVNKAGGSSGSADVSLKYNPEPDSEEKNFLTKHTFGLQTVGTSAMTINYYVPKRFTGPGILKIQTVSGNNNLDLSAGFDGILQEDL